MLMVLDLLTLYNQVFLLLVAEMGLFMLLVIPMPFTVKRRMFTYVAISLSTTRTAFSSPNKFLERQEA